MVNFESITAELLRYPQIQLAMVFGSLASGTATPSSDLDIAVQAQYPLSIDEKMALIGDLAVVTGRSVDLVDLRCVGGPLLNQILRHGKRICGSDSDYAELALRNIYANEDFMPYVRRALEERRRAWIGL
ncbi:Nucleotidyltransferase domain-containing protein [Gammaproteobacteria bacterium]